MLYVVCSPAILHVQRFGYQVLVGKDDAWAVPHGELAVLDTAEDICGVVPRYTVNHAAYRSENTHVGVCGRTFTRLISRLPVLLILQILGSWLR